MSIHVRLRALNDQVTTNYSTISAIVTHPVAPTLVGTGGILTWNAPSAQSSVLEYSAGSAFSTVSILDLNSETYTFTTPGMYYVRVRASYNGKFTEYSNIVYIVVEPPPAPTLSFLPRNEYDSVALSWSAVPGLDTYSVEYATNTGFINPTVTQVTGTQYKLDLPTQVYSFRVRALSGSIANDSNVITQPIIYRTKPDVPILSIESRNEYEQAKLFWTSPTDTLFNEYVVEYATNEGFTDAGVTTLTTQSYQTTLPPGRYYFRMRVKHKQLNVYTDYSYIDVIILPIPVAPVLTIAQENEYSNSLQLTWTNTHPLFNQYVLEYSLSQDFTNAVRNIRDTNTLPVTLTPGVWYFRVYAYVGTAKTAYSVAVSTNIQAIPSPPNILPLSRTNYENISLSWPDSPTPFNRYEMSYSTNPGFTNAVVTNLAKTIYEPELPPGTYYFRLRAKHQSLNVYTNYYIVSATLSPLPSSINLSVATRKLSDPIVLNWDSGADGHTITTTKGSYEYTKLNTYTVSNSMFSLPEMFTIDVTAYYGLHNTLPVKGIVIVTTQKYVPRNLALSVVRTEYTSFNITRSRYQMKWSVDDQPNDAVYDIYHESFGTFVKTDTYSPQTLFDSGTPYYYEFLPGQYKVRLRSIYGVIYSNIITLPEFY